MSQCCGYSMSATIIKSHHSAVRERELQLSLTLLACHLSCDRTVHLVGEPVLARYSFQSEHLTHLAFDIIGGVWHVGILALHSMVTHDGLGRVSKHLAYFQVKWAYPISLFEGKVGISCGFTHHIEWCTLTLCYLAHMIDMMFIDEQSHALLTLVGNDFLSRQSVVAYGELIHVDESSTVLHQLTQTVDMPSTSVVVNAHHGIGLFFTERAYQIVGSLLHLRIGSLYGIEFYATAVSSGLHTGYRTATQSDAVVVSAYHHHLVALLRSSFQAVTTCAVSHSSCQHHHFVIGILLIAFLVFEGEY